MASPDRRLARVLAGVLLATLCSSGNCTVKVSTDDDCDPDDPECGAEEQPPVQTFEIVVIERDGSQHHGWGWAEPWRAR